jgi:hypothetical protein
MYVGEVRLPALEVESCDLLNHHTSYSIVFVLVLQLWRAVQLKIQPTNKSYLFGCFVKNPLRWLSK